MIKEDMELSAEAAEELRRAALAAARELAATTGTQPGSCLAWLLTWSMRRVPGVPDEPCG